MYVMQRVRSRTVANKHAGKTGHGTGLSTGPPPTRRKSNGEKTGLRTGPHANRRRKTGHGTGLPTGPAPNCRNTRPPHRQTRQTRGRHSASVLVSSSSVGLRLSVFLFPSFCVPSRPSAFGFRFSAFGLRLSVFGCRSSAFGLRLSVFGFRLSVFGFRLSVFGFRLSVFGFRLSVFGFRHSALCSATDANVLLAPYWFSAFGLRFRTSAIESKPPSDSPDHVSYFAWTGTQSVHSL